MRFEAHLFSGLGGWFRFLSRDTRILEKMVDALPHEANFDPEKGMATGSWIQRLVETVEFRQSIFRN